MSKMKADTIYHNRFVYDFPESSKMPIGKLPGFIDVQSVPVVTIEFFGLLILSLQAIYSNLFHDSLHFSGSSSFSNIEFYQRRDAD